MSSKQQGPRPDVEYHFTERQLATAMMLYLRDIHGIPISGVAGVRVSPLDAQEDVAAVVELHPGLKMPGSGSIGVRRNVGFKDGAGI